MTRLTATQPVEVTTLCIHFPEWNPTESSLLQHLYQGHFHRAPHFHFINIHSQESKTGISQGQQDNSNGVICRQRYCKCAKPLILEAAVYLEQESQWHFPVSPGVLSKAGRKGKVMKGVQNLYLYGEIFSNSNGLKSWEVTQIHREFSSHFYGQVSSVSFCIRNWNDKYPRHLHLHPFKSLLERRL